MDRFFEVFVRERAVDLRRLSYKTKGDMSPDDFASEAYLMALEIGERQGRVLSFGDPEDQDLILRALNVEHVKRGDWRQREASRIDRDADDEDGYSPIVIPAPETADPLALLLAEEGARSALDESYSQAAAYVVVFSTFGNNTGKLSAYLVISTSTLNHRVRVAIATVFEQPSIFDRIERISDDFMPLPGKAYATRVEQGGEAEQLAWEFEDAPA